MNEVTMENSNLFPAASPVGESSIELKILQIRSQPVGLLSSGILDTISQDDPALNCLADIAEQIMGNPMAMRRLSERVLEMLRLDLQHQRERGNQYRPW